LATTGLGQLTLVMPFGQIAIKVISTISIIKVSGLFREATVIKARASPDGGI